MDPSETVSSGAEVSGEDTPEDSGEMSSDRSSVGMEEVSGGASSMGASPEAKA